MMFRKAELFVMALAIVVVACLAANVDLYGMPRTLYDGEMAALRGGSGPHQNSCCVEIAVCTVGTDVSCNSYNMMMCVGSVSKTWIAGNRKKCQSMPIFNGKTCEDDDTLHACYQETTCTWDGSNCLSSGTVSAEVKAPDDCDCA